MDWRQGQRCLSRFCADILGIWIFDEREYLILWARHRECRVFAQGSPWSPLAPYARTVYGTERCSPSFWTLPDEQAQKTIFSSQV
jgi:hypothetical protein